ncbi:MAG: general secretion pathway protein GspB [Steroidobacteraceae bacterium]|nr:general secretion pathway protein GspB [Steroidobacteraceae bacterium]
MSIILDALKKSENDRQRQSAPGMFEVKVAPPRARFPVWAVGFGVLLGMSLLAFVGLLWRMGVAEQATAQRTGDVDAATRAADGSGATTVAERPRPTADSVTIGGATNNPAGVATVTVTVPSGVTAPNVTVGPGQTPFGQVPQSLDPGGIVAPSSAPPLVEEPVLAAGAQSIPPDYNPADYAPAVSADTAARNARNKAGDIPTRDEVVTSGQARVPDLRLDLHVYANNPAERFVFINMRKLREGEALPDGVRVESITPTGAVLSFRGTRFQLQSE